MLLRYLRALPAGKAVLWCYLIWYLVVVARYFDPSRTLWLNALGIAGVIGVALLLSVSGPGTRRPDGWQVFRLFAMPFCVSSFSQLIKGRGFFLVVPPRTADLAWCVGACVVFLAGVGIVKLGRR